MRRKFLFVLSFFLILGLALTGAVLAEEAKQAPKPAAKKAPSKTTQKDKKASAKEAAPSTPSAGEDLARKEFEVFAQDYVTKLNSNMICNASRKEVEAKGGRYVARYNEVDRSSLVLEVTPYPSAQTPFVGKITYVESVYECEADTPAAAQNGPFVTVKSISTTEVFPYTNKRWKY